MHPPYLSLKEHRYALGILALLITFASSFSYYRTTEVSIEKLTNKIESLEISLAERQTHIERLELGLENTRSQEHANLVRLVEASMININKDIEELKQECLK